MDNFFVINCAFVGLVSAVVAAAELRTQFIFCKLNLFNYETIIVEFNMKQYAVLLMEGRHESFKF